MVRGISRQGDPRGAAAAWSVDGSIEGLEPGDQLRASDLGKLLRRAKRGIVGVARADDRPSFVTLIGEHLGARLQDTEVVEESWPAYDLVNIQLGLNAWLAEDADVVFLLTTNRADLLEPALAARPGRVDQAVPLELPDADARRRLIELYRGALSLDETRLDTVIDKTEGVTASFLKELLRRSALLAASETASDELVVTAAQLDSALEELLDTRNVMTRLLLGGGRSG